MKNIAHRTLNLPQEAPVMVLANAVLFPHALLPLHMFEDRYRKMLDHCLERDRMFLIALLKPGVLEAVSEDDYFHTAGLGLIRACVGNPDGTSNLILQGVARVEMLDLVAATPFRIAQIRHLQSEAGDGVEAEALSVKVVELCSALKDAGIEVPAALAKQLPHLSDPDILSDVVAHTFVEDPFDRQLLLGQSRVLERLRLLITHLQRQLGGADGGKS